LQIDALSEGDMKKFRFSVPRIAKTLKKAEAGCTVAGVAYEYGVLISFSH